MGAALSTRELAQRLIRDRNLATDYHYTSPTPRTRASLSLDDLLIIKTIGKRTLDGWDDMDMEGNDD